MPLLFEDHGTVLIIRAQETEIGADNSPDLRLQMMKHVQPDNYLAVDLSPVTFMDSSGLSFFVALLKRVREKGACRVFGMQPRVMELFRLTRLDNVFAIDPNEDTAVTMLEEGARKSRAA